MAKHTVKKNINITWCPIFRLFLFLLFLFFSTAQAKAEYRCSLWMWYLDIWYLCKSGPFDRNTCISTAVADHFRFIGKDQWTMQTANKSNCQSPLPF